MGEATTAKKNADDHCRPISANFERGQRKRRKKQNEKMQPIRTIRPFFEASGVLTVVSEPGAFLLAASFFYVLRQVGDFSTFFYSPNEPYTAAFIFTSTVEAAPSSFTAAFPVAIQLADVESSADSRIRARG